jgi:hypothetical protein
VIVHGDFGYSSASGPVLALRGGANCENRSMRFSARGGAGLAFAGLVVVLVGAFLPWLRSGSALRDSYQSVDVLRVQPAPPGGAAGVLLYAWLAVIPLCSVSVALYALGVRRTAAALACLVAVLVAVVSIAAVLNMGAASDPIGFSPIGPIVTLLGAAGAFLGGIVVLRRLQSGVQR